MGLFHPSSSSSSPFPSPSSLSFLLTCVLKWILLFHVITITIVSSSSQGSSGYEDPLLRVGDRIHLPDYSSYVLDSTFHQAKDIVVNKRKLEADLVRKGNTYCTKLLFFISDRKIRVVMWYSGIYTDMTKRTAVTRHQAVTTTFNNANELEKNQEVFEEMTKLMARK